MKEIPGYIYDTSIRNYIPIASASHLLKNKLKEDINKKSIEFKNDNLKYRCNLTKYNYHSKSDFIFHNSIFIRNDIKNLFLATLYNFRDPEPIKTDDLSLYGLKTVVSSLEPINDEQVMINRTSLNPTTDIYFLAKHQYKRLKNGNYSYSIVKEDNINSFINLRLGSCDNNCFGILESDCLEFYKTDDLSRTRIDLELHQPTALDVIDSTSATVTQTNPSGNVDIISINSGQIQRFSSHWQGYYKSQNICVNPREPNSLILGIQRRQTTIKGSDMIVPIDLRVGLPRFKQLQRQALCTGKYSYMGLTKIPGISHQFISDCADDKSRQLKLWDIRYAKRSILLCDLSTSNNTNNSYQAMPIHVSQGAGANNQHLITFTTMPSCVTYIIDLKAASSTGGAIHSDNSDLLKYYNCAGNTISTENVMRCFSYFSTNNVDYRPNIIHNFTDNQHFIQQWTC